MQHVLNVWDINVMYIIVHLLKYHVCQQMYTEFIGLVGKHLHRDTGDEGAAATLQAAELVF